MLGFVPTGRAEEGEAFSTNRWSLRDRYASSFRACCPTTTALSPGLLPTCTDNEGCNFMGERLDGYMVEWLKINHITI